MVKTFPEILLRQFLFPRSEHLLVSSATFLCKTQNILTLSMIVDYNLNSFFLRSLSLLCTDTVGLFQFINNQGLK